MSTANDNIFEDAEFTEVTAREPGRSHSGDLPHQTGLATIPQVAANAIDLAPMIQYAAMVGTRDLKAMLAEARRVGELLGRDGFYSFPAGGGRIEGASIDLAYALAQVWGRCISSCEIVSTEKNVVQFRGRFIDLLTLNIVARDYRFTLSPPPGKFADKPDQADRWRVMQEQAATSKAIRGVILGGLPAWFVNAALEQCYAIASDKLLKGKTLPQASADAIAYAVAFGLTEADLIAHLDRPTAMWTTAELDVLRTLFADIKAGRTNAAAIKPAAKPTNGRASPIAAPAVDAVAAAEAAEARRNAAKPAEGGESTNLADLPSPVADRLATFAEELKTDVASVVAFLNSKGRDPAKLTDDKALSTTMLALSKGGGMHEALLDYIGRGSK